MQGSPDVWKAWYDLEMPEQEPLPMDYSDKLSRFQILSILRCLRPDRVQEKKEKKETQGSEITTMQNKSCNNDGITVPVIIHGIQDELSISRLLNVHSSFKQSELEESITEEKRITNAMLKNTKNYRKISSMCHVSCKK